MIPSKELVRKVVFREDVFSYENLDTCRGFAITYDECGFGKYMSYFELAHKCKEWALKQGYIYIGDSGVILIYLNKNIVKKIADESIKNWYDVSIDFLACEWIMEQTK